MIASVQGVIGRTGLLLLSALLLSLLGTALAATIGAALVMIPLIGLIGIVLAVFPTLTVYLAAGFALYLLLVIALRMGGVSKTIGLYPALGLLSIGASLGAGWAAAQRLNAEAGLVAALADEPALPPAKVTPGSTLALISERYFFPQRPCDTVCLTLLLGGEVGTLLVARSEGRPDAQARFPGHALSWGPQGHECLRGKSYYTMMVGGNDSERRESFRDGFGGNLEYELAECLTTSEVEIDPLAQTTIINWEEYDPERTADTRLGVRDAPQLQAVIVPAGDGLPRISQRSGKEGFRYFAPLVINPYSGNAGMGGRFTPRLYIEYFRTIPYKDSQATGWWPLIDGSEAMIDRSIAFLEEVTIRESFTEWRERTGRE